MLKKYVAPVAVLTPAAAPPIKLPGVVKVVNLIRFDVPFVPPEETNKPEAPTVRATSEPKVSVEEVAPVVYVDWTVPWPPRNESAPRVCVSAEAVLAELKLNVPPPVVEAPKVSACAPSVPPAEMTTEPPLIVRAPVVVFAPLSVSVPAPVLVIAFAPVVTAPVMTVLPVPPMVKAKAPVTFARVA